MVTLDEAGRGAPTPLPLPAGSPLAPFVEHAWIQTATPKAAARRVVPDPSGHVVVAVCAGGRIRASVVGARSRFCDVDGGRRFTVGVRFRPGALPSLLRLPASDLTDRGVPLEDVLPGAARGLDRAAAGDAEGCLAALLESLGRRSLVAARRDWRVRALEAAFSRPDRVEGVQVVARRLGLAPRTLRGVVTEQVGLAPSMWLRVRRAHRALELALGDGQPLSRAALAAGYYDQPHMVRDFHALLGETPTDFVARRRRAA